MHTLIGIVVIVGSVLLMAISRTNEHLARIARLLERANEMKQEDRTGEWRERF